MTTLAGTGRSGSDWNCPLSEERLQKKLLVTIATSVLLFLYAIDCTKWQKWQWWPDLVGKGRRQQPQAGCEAIWPLHLWPHGNPDACCMARTGCSPAARRSTALVAAASPAKQPHSSHTTLQVTFTTAVLAGVCTEVAGVSC